MKLIQEQSRSIIGIASMAVLLSILTGPAWAQNEYTVLKSFAHNGAQGSGPKASLVLAGDGMLYGTTSLGGDTGNGTVFRMNPDGSGFQVIYSFPGFSSDNNPVLIEGRDGALYGTTRNSSSSGSGTLFKLNKDGTGFQVLHNFSFSSQDGARPMAGVTEGSDGLLYGTTELGGTESEGTVFRVDRNGNNFTVLHSFGKGNDGYNPRTALLEASDGKLYGTTTAGGVPGGYSPTPFGTVFRMNKDGSQYEVLHSFQSGPVIGSGTPNGSTPEAGLIEGGDGMLYGTTKSGGDTFGTIFKIARDGTQFAVLHRFEGSVDGGLPYAALVQGADGLLYGTTYGASSQQFGTLYRINPNGADYSVLFRFQGYPDPVGGRPYATLVTGDGGTFFGTTSAAGQNLGGTAFKYFVQMSSQRPQITGPPQGATACAGQSVSLSVTATGSSPLLYQWRFHGTDAAGAPADIRGANAATLTLNNLRESDAGYYSVLVRNTAGSVTSTPVAVVVQEVCVDIRMYAGLTIEGQAGRTYVISYASDLSKPVWTPLATNTLGTEPWFYVDRESPSNPKRFYKVTRKP
jgi:uncharacterized repeat protein (TIGR03803 family)